MVAVALDPTTLPLPVVETFHSLQGEGAHAGRSAFFIRLGGCSVGCSWCDTKHSWPEASHPLRTPAKLARLATRAVRAGAGFVVITGGEPLHHNLDALCAALGSPGAEDEDEDRAEAVVSEGGGGSSPPSRLPLHLETSGVDPFSGRFNWITLSPKPHRPPTDEALGRCHELKVVVHGPADLRFAEQMAAAALRTRPGSGALAGRRRPLLLLQPGWDSTAGQALAVDFVRRHPHWRLSLQTHRWLGVR